MADKILNSFDVWIAAQGWKSKLRLKSVDNISLEGIAAIRELILELAIRGKLAQQISTEEPASELIIKMANEEEDLVKRKIIKKPKDLPPINSEEFPFELPVGWEYIRLNNIGEWGAGATPLRGKSEYYGGDIPWFKSGELSSDFISKSVETVTELALKETSLRYNKVGDVLIAMYGATIGKTSILNIPATTNQAVCACTPFSGVYNVYLLHLLKAYNKRFVDMGAGGAQPNISREKIIATVIALPPLKEQHRIVAKVDELMALCDELEQQETKHLKSHQLLVETLLGTLTQAKDAAEFQTAWGMLSQHFDDLFITEDSIDQLKQTILQLAVMGKLVPQNPKDEPASVLLEKIKKEKERMIKTGLIKKEKPMPEIQDSEKPFKLPFGWEWARPDDFSLKITDGEHFRPVTQNQGIYFLSAKDIREDGVSLDEPLFISKQVAEKALQRCNPEKGDILIVSRGATVGRMCVVDVDDVFCLLGSVILVKPVKLIMSEYLKVVMKTPQAFNQLVSASGSTAQPAIYLRDLKKILFPIAPLAEQQHIVTKVDELFALCDRLKERIGESQKVANQMAEAVLEQV